MKSKSKKSHKLKKGSVGLTSEQIAEITDIVLFVGNLTGCKPLPLLFRLIPEVSLQKYKEFVDEWSSYGLSFFSNLQYTREDFEECLRDLFEDFTVNIQTLFIYRNWIEDLKEDDIVHLV